MPTTDQNPLPPRDVSADADPFSHLYKMSTTAGLGSGDYVAINGWSLAALLLGIASCLVLWGSLLLMIIPALALVTAIIAIRQVLTSNGTQTGLGLAILGILLALGMGGGYGAKIGLESLRNSREQQQVVAVIEEFGALIRDAKYEQAYDLFDDRFRSHVAEPVFIEAWKRESGSTFRGGITGASSNGLLIFEDDPVTGQRHSTGIMLIGFEKIRAQDRQAVILAKIDDGWKIDQMPDIFPPESTAKNAAPTGGAIGPPAPMKNK